MSYISNNRPKRHSYNIGDNVFSGVLNKQNFQPIKKSYSTNKFLKNEKQPRKLRITLLDEKDVKKTNFDNNKINYLENSKNSLNRKKVTFGRRSQSSNLKNSTGSILKNKNNFQNKENIKRNIVYTKNRNFNQQNSLNSQNYEIKNRYVNDNMKNNFVNLNNDVKQNFNYNNNQKNYQSNNIYRNSNNFKNIYQNNNNFDNNYQTNKNFNNNYQNNNNFKNIYHSDNNFEKNYQNNFPKSNIATRTVYAKNSYIKLDPEEKRNEFIKNFKNNYKNNFQKPKKIKKNVEIIFPEKKTKYELFQNNDLKISKILNEDYKQKKEIPYNTNYNSNFESFSNFEIQKTKNLEEKNFNIFLNTKKEKKKKLPEKRKKSDFENNYNIFFKKKEIKKDDLKELNDSYLELYYKDKNEEKNNFMENYMKRRKEFLFNTKNMAFPDKMGVKLNNCFDDIHSLNYFKRITEMKYNLEISNLVDRVIRRSEKSLEAILQEHEFT